MSKTKYVLVRRDNPEYNDIAMTAATYADIDNTPFYSTVCPSPEPITLTAIRKERIRIYTDEEHAQYVKNCAEHEAWDKLRTQYHKKPPQATVDWFDRMRGEGSVTVEGVGRFDIYACNIKGCKTWYPETACVYYTKGQTVEVELDMHARKVIFCLGKTEGTLDVEAWDRIKDQKLAFRCNEQGEAITGLLP